jgi:hypothetical protein
LRRMNGGSFSRLDILTSSKSQKSTYAPKDSPCIDARNYPQVHRRAVNSGYRQISQDHGQKYPVRAGGPQGIKWGAWSLLIVMLVEAAKSRFVVGEV